MAPIVPLSGFFSERADFFNESSGGIRNIVVFLHQLPRTLEEYCFLMQE